MMKSSDPEPSSSLAARCVSTAPVSPVASSVAASVSSSSGAALASSVAEGVGDGVTVLDARTSGALTDLPAAAWMFLEAG